ncbi:MAG: glutamyl-tRNA reductase [Acidimicrobiales bacterium]
MSVVVIGLNHRSAPLDVLERVAVPEAALPKALHDLRLRPNLSEAVVLSTCHRVEVYAVAERFHAGYAELRDFLIEQAGLAPDRVADALYFHHDVRAASHLFGVAAGLDSAVLGESEILGQVADAWDGARAEGAAGPMLNLLFRHALEAGKRARTATGISRGITSVSQAAVAMAADRVGGVAGRRVVVVGAGSMGEQLARVVAGSQPAELVVVNRTPAAAEMLANELGARVAPLSALPSTLDDVDVCITSTGAPIAILDHDDLEAAAERRGGRPLLVVDVAVPRNVVAAAADIPGLTLLDIDDVNRFVESNIDDRRREAERARRLLDDQLERYVAESTAREVAPLVLTMRRQAEAVRRAELDRLSGRLAGLDERQRDAVEALTKGIMAKLLHEPTVRLKDAAGTPRGERLADALRELFDL